MNNIMIMFKDKKKAFSLVLMFLLVLFGVTGCNKSSQETVSEDIQPPVPLGQADSQADNKSVNVPTEEGVPGAVGKVVDVDANGNGAVVSDKMVSVALENVGRGNPFVPTDELSTYGGSARLSSLNFDVSTSDLSSPPMGSDKDSDASKVVTTKISGIMYDKNTPSAILNIEDSDYLVRSGDVINGYKILEISPQSVTVQLGSNVYKAGVGEIVSSDDEGLNYNDVSNLSNKFGGSKK